MQRGSFVIFSAHWNLSHYVTPSQVEGVIKNFKFCEKGRSGVRPWSTSHILERENSSEN